MTTQHRLAASFARLLRCYPTAWRARHQDEMLAVLLDQAEAEGRSTVGWRAGLDVVGHGLEARLDALVGEFPERFRRQTATVALVVAAGLSLLFLGGEVLTARARPPADQIEYFGEFFISGPFMTIGVGLYLACLSAALLVVRRRPGWARVLLVAAAAFAAWMAVTRGGPYPVPNLLLLVLLLGLTLLASTATLDLDRRGRRGLLGWGGGFVVAVALALLLTRFVLAWSVGTMTTSGNVAVAALAVALPVVSAAAFTVSAALHTRHPGWPPALAVAALPVVVFCTGTSIAVNPAQAPVRIFIPLAYVLVVAAVAAVARRRGLRPAGR